MNKPLSSDAWSSFGVVDAENNKHNKEIKEATKFLFEQVIPAFTEAMKVTLMGETAAYMVNLLFPF